MWLLLAATIATAAEPPTIAAARLGIGDRYKLGCWAPLRLEVQGGEQPLAVQSLVVTPDTDGVGVATTAAAGRPLATEPGATSTDTVYVRVGQTGAELQARLIADGRAVARRTFSTDSQWSGNPAKLGEEFQAPVAATDRLYLQIGGPGDTAGGRMLLDLETLDEFNDLAAAYTPNADALPRDPIGYESYDAVLLLAGAEGADWLGELTGSDSRIEALSQWVESGGRLVVSCGAKGADLLAPGAPLARFLPGEYAGPTTLANAAAIESYTDATDDAGRLPLAAPLRVSNLTDVRGVVGAYGGRSTGDTPLVIRTPYGFGEVTFVAFDLDSSAIAAWRGRAALLLRLLAIEPTDESRGGSVLPWGGYRAGQDFVSQLTRRLDLEFTGVSTAPFLLIVGLVLLYLLLIGPGDYFFVKNVLKRVEATWVTFPILVVATSAAAYAGAYWLKGDKLRINQVEILGIDAATGQTRGTLLTHLFSPRAQRYDLGLQTRTLDGAPLSAETSSTAWLGKPGSGLGGMQAGAGRTGARRIDYQIDPTPLLSGGRSGPTVAGLPVQVWSTKTLISRYTGEATRVVEAQLTPDRDGLVEGLLTNDTGAKLDDCRLLYGLWAWRLGSLADGETKSVDPSIDPIKTTTLLRQSNEPSATSGAKKLGSVAAMAESLSVGGLRGGATGPASRYLGHLDLSHHLEAGAAVLLCRVEGGPLSRLTSDGKPLADPENEDPEGGDSLRSWVFARFILPVGEG